MAQITVTINGRSYRMACHDGQEEHLKALAEQLDNNIQQLRADFGEAGDQRLTVMAGIMALDELFELKAQIKALKGELKTAQHKTCQEQNHEGEERLAAALNDAARRIQEMAARLGGPEQG